MYSGGYPVKVFATRGSDGLLAEICRCLQSRLAKEFQPDGRLELGQVKFDLFSNENLEAQVENVRGHFVVVIHTQVPPVHERLFELFHLLHAVYNARPADVLLVFPYMPYSRSDRKNKPRISTMGELLPKFFTNCLEIKRVILLDPHDTHLKHYFAPAADEISAIYLFADWLERIFFKSRPKENCVIVFPDSGAAKRFEDLPRLVNLPTVYIDKGRIKELGKNDSETAQTKKVVGEVGAKDCIMIDDEIMTGGTVIEDTRLLLEAKANSVSMLAIHAVLADRNLSQEELMLKLEKSPVAQFIVTDSIPLRHKLSPNITKFTILPIAPLLAEAIARTVQNESLTDLHNPERVHLYQS